MNFLLGKTLPELSSLLHIPLFCHLHPLVHTLRTLVLHFSSHGPHGCTDGSTWATRLFPHRHTLREWHKHSMQARSFFSPCCLLGSEFAFFLFFTFFFFIASWVIGHTLRLGIGFGLGFQALRMGH
jgi:hypothetical protein